MPYKTFWHTPDTIVYAEIIGEFSGCEMEAINAELRDAYLDKGQHPIHLIIDASAVNSYPHNVRAIQQAFRDYLKHPSLGWVLFIGFNNATMNFLATAIMRLVGVRFKHVSTLTEAEQFLSQIDDHLVETVKTASTSK